MSRKFIQKPPQKPLGVTSQELRAADAKLAKADFMTRLILLVGVFRAVQARPDSEVLRRMLLDGLGQVEEALVKERPSMEEMFEQAKDDLIRRYADASLEEMTDLATSARSKKAH